MVKTSLYRMAEYFEKSRNYDRAAGAWAELGEHSKAARFYSVAGDRHREAAVSYSASGDRPKEYESYRKAQTSYL